MAKVCPPECLQIVLSAGCCGIPLLIEEDSVANDQRVLAHVSCEEARTYIRGVNAHHEKGTRRYRMQMRGCFACFLLGAALFGTLMGVFQEEKRLRCQGRICGRGEDPLTSGCCNFWCCGEEMKGKKKQGCEPRKKVTGKRKKNDDLSVYCTELPARPDDRWDVWANETFFDNAKRCALYDEKHDKLKKLDEKRDAGWKCDSCPGALLQNEDGGQLAYCRTMFEGKVKEHETWWPTLFVIPWFLAIGVLLKILWCDLPKAHHGIYAEAFEDWRARGVVTHIEFQGAIKKKKKSSKPGTPNYLRLYFPAGKAEPVITGTVVHAAAALGTP